MALEDLLHILQSLGGIVPSGEFNLSYYLVLTGFIILVGFGGVVLATLAVRTFLSLFKKPPSYAIKVLIVTGLILFLLGIIMP